MARLKIPDVEAFETWLLRVPGRAQLGPSAAALRADDLVTFPHGWTKVQAQAKTGRSYRRVARAASSSTDCGYLLFSAGFPSPVGKVAP